MNSENGPDQRPEQPGWGAPAANRSQVGSWGEAYGPSPDTGAPPGAAAPPGASRSPLNRPPSPLSGSPFDDSPYGPIGGTQPAEWDARYPAPSDPYGVSPPAGAPPHGAAPYGAPSNGTAPYDAPPNSAAPYGFPPNDAAPYGAPPNALLNNAPPFLTSPDDAAPGDVLTHGAPPMPGAPFESPPGPPSDPPFARPGGPPGPGGFDPAPRRRGKSNRGLVLGGVMSGVLALILAAALIVTVVSGNSGGRSISNAEGKKAADQLNRAGQHLATMAAAQYKGTVDASGNQNKVEVQVTKSGSAAGSFTVGEKDVETITVGNQTYAKGDKNFWIKLGKRETSATAVGTNWGKLDQSASRDFQFPAPSALAQTLQRTTDEQVRSSVPANVAGVQTAKIGTSAGTFYVTTAEPRRVVRMELSKGGTLFTVDLTQLSGSRVQRLYGELMERARTLKGARDPDVLVTATPKLSFGKRSASGIIVKAKVTPAVQGGATSLGATMSVKMTAGKRKIGGCTGTQTIKASGSTTMSCVNRTGAWRSWFANAKQTPGFHRYAAKVNVAAFAYAGVNVDQVVSGIDQERGGG